MIIALEPRTAPRTVASLAALVERRFFDGTVFHRLIPGRLIQGGDPTAAGAGGPGYDTADPPPSNARYTKGVVAMAKQGQEPPGAAGSQFFIVLAADLGLPPEYAIVGRVVRGIEVAERIGELGDPASGDTGVPLRPAVIERATLRKSDK
jgi:cyclophilin family peptidyl-prolyl cis-trans isomerase